MWSLLDLSLSIVMLWVFLSSLLWSVKACFTLLALAELFISGDSFDASILPFHFLKEDDEGNIKWSLHKSVFDSFTWPKHIYKLIVKIGKTLEL